MKKRTIGTLLAALFVAGGAVAQNNGGIDAAMYKEISESYKPTTSEKALQNILMGNPIKALSLNQENLGEMNTYFSHSVSSKGITNQESSGRCWLFTGMNVMRAKMIAEQDRRRPLRNNRGQCEERGDGARIHRGDAKKRKNRCVKKFLLY